MRTKTLAIALSAVLATGLAAQDALAGKGGGGGGGGGHSGGGGMPGMDMGRGMPRGGGSGSTMPGSGGTGGMGRGADMPGQGGSAYKGQGVDAKARETYRLGEDQGKGELERIRKGDFSD